MTDTPKPPLTTDEVGRRLTTDGFEAATATTRKWVARETINAADLCAELRYWLSYLGGA